MASLMEQYAQNKQVGRYSPAVNPTNAQYGPTLPTGFGQQAGPPKPAVYGNPSSTTPQKDQYINRTTDLSGTYANVGGDGCPLIRFQKTY